MTAQGKSLEVMANVNPSETRDGFTSAQLAALRWLHDFPSNKAGWRRNGRSAYGDSRKWDAMKVEGYRGSIVIQAEDWRALSGLIDGCPSPDKIYGPSAEGRELLKMKPRVEAEDRRRP